MKIIEAIWDKYREECISVNAGPVQVTNTKHAFYAGAFLTLDVLAKTANTQSLETATKMIESLHKEILIYIENLAD
jgi:hypothetical protein